MEVFKILNFWVHLVSAFIWVGGILFTSMILLPTLRSSLVKEVGESFLLKLHAKFQKASAVLVTLILITGGINIHFSHQMRGAFSNRYFVALSVKILFFTLLLSIYLLNLKNLSDAEKKPGIQRLPFQDTSLILGVLIILMAAFLKHTP